jgi:hypothetical protein
MPRFHFPIVNGQRVEDPVGIELADDNAAKVQAVNIAHHIRKAMNGTQRNVLVENENGDKVGKAPVTKD